MKAARRDRARSPEVELERDDWARHGNCNNNPDMWFEPDARKAAAHICLNHCPVLSECSDALAGTPRKRLCGAVMAGVIHDNEGHETTFLPDPTCRTCRRVPCAQCGRRFEPATRNTILCSRQCKRDRANVHKRRYDRRKAAA